MWRYGRNTLIGVIGLTAASLGSLPAFAGDFGKGWHRHGGTRTVTVVKKVVHVKQYHRRHRHGHRRRIVHYVPRPVVVHRPAPARVIRHDHYYGRGSGGRTLAGGVIGAAIGALAGNGIGSGSGRTAAIIGGAVIGAIVGGNIGQSMDRVDAVQASDALETARTGQTVSWRNPDNGASYHVTPTRTYRMETGRYCRDFTTWGWIDGYEEKLHGTACRMDDGTWRKVG